MHIGLVGGIGPAATDYYYRGLIRSLAGQNNDLQLTIAHAASSTLLENLGREDQPAQAVIFLGLLAQLKAAGARTAAITSIAGHFCIDEVKQASPLPIIDIVGEVDTALARSKLRKVGLIGTNNVMESRFYGGISSVEIVVPAEPERERVHRSYVAMALSGQVTDQQRQVFFSAGRTLCQEHGAEAVMLGGTDLFLAFDGRDCGFHVVDCARIHVDALAKVAAEP